MLSGFDFDLDFYIFEKNKKRRSIYIFILYILIFCSFVSKKSEVFQGFTDVYRYKKLCIPLQKTMYTATKNYVYRYKKLLKVAVL